jgi:hypothetical protein
MNTYIGKCLCCKKEDISNTNFEYGHIMSKKNCSEVTIVIAINQLVEIIWMNL